MKLLYILGYKSQMELILVKHSGHILKNYRSVFPTNTDIKAKPSV